MEVFSSRAFVFLVVLTLVLSLTAHNFLEHEHFGEDHKEHGHEDSHEQSSAIGTFFHGEDRKIFWMILALISMLVGIISLFENHYYPIVGRISFSELEYFVIPFRRALNRGVINPKIYSTAIVPVS